jgi:hypothetical protein
MESKDISKKPTQQYFRLIDLVNATFIIGWDYYQLSGNKNITMNDISNNLKPTLINDLSPFNRYDISDNPNLMIEFILKYPDIFPYYPELDNEKYLWNWSSISINKNIKFTDIVNYPDLPWDYERVSHRFYKETTDYSFILKYKYEEWSWYLLSMYVDPTFIFSHPDLPWNLKRISSNIKLKWSHIITHKDFDWDYDEICAVIPLDDLINNNISINYKQLSINPTLTTSYFLAHIDEKWNDDSLVKNFGLNFDQIAMSDKDCSFLCSSFRTHIDTYKGILYNKFDNDNITFKFIDKYYYSFNIDNFGLFHKQGIITLDNCLNDPKYLNYKLLSVNPTLTLNFVISNINKDWDFLEILANPVFTITDLIEIYNKKYNTFDDVIFKTPYLQKLLINPNLKYDYIIKNVKNITTEIIYLMKINDPNYYDIANNLSINEYNLEYKTRKIVEKIITKFKRKMVNKFLISDLSNIIIEY